jgi:HPt (histidine-containing phosphotransfer) domain-containing protein
VLGGLVAAHRFASAARDGGAPSVAGAAASVDDAIERLAAKMEDLSGEILGSSGSAAADDDLDDMATELLKLEGARI